MEKKFELIPKSEVLKIPQRSPYWIEELMLITLGMIKENNAEGD